MQTFFRPIPCPRTRAGARPLAGGLFGFTEVEIRPRGGIPEIVPVDAAEAMHPEAGETFPRFSEQRHAIVGMDMARPVVMGVVNVTPDSFSDGGSLSDAYAAIDHGMALAEAGADILDIGGESTRPGAEPVPEEREAERVLPVITGLIERGCKTPISIDTRKASVARAALAAGARMFNDVSALTHDPVSLEVAREAGGLCLMHAQGDPRTMQEDPQYNDVLLDVYEYLAGRIAAAEVAGVRRDQIVIDPGIGFGKTLEHNLALLRGLSMFHGLGCPILLGVSRKGFIGRLSGEAEAARRAPGSIAAGLAGLAQGVQILRVHDVAETVQAVRVWQALEEEGT